MITTGEEKNLYAITETFTSKPKSLQAVIMQQTCLYGLNTINKMSRDIIFVYASRVKLRNSILQQSKFSPLCIYSHRRLNKSTENFVRNCNWPNKK
jgi:hypothetical protein